MLISHVRFRGFRSLKEVDVNLVRYNTLIGKNDSGKSCFLLGLQFLFDPDSELSGGDKCNLPGYEGECSIEATLEACTHELATDGKLQVRGSGSV
jgi:recombinational DNA repair ATPase RecF